MIKASDIILQLQEHWITLFSGKKVEIIVNPSTWMEAARDLKSELSYVVQTLSAGPILRFGYSPDNGDINVWVGYRATHEQIYTWENEDEWDRSLFGYIDTRKHLSVVVSDKKTYLKFEELPEKLQRFLRGTRLVVDIEDRLVF